VTFPVVLFVGAVVWAPPVMTLSPTDAGVAVGEVGVFKPGRVIRLLVGTLEARGIVDALELPTVEDAMGGVDGMELPRMDTVPDRSIVVAVFASGLAVRGNPKTLQMLAMAPKVAAAGEVSLPSLQAHVRSGRSLTLLAIGSRTGLIDTGIQTINIGRIGTKTWPLCLHTIGAINIGNASELVVAIDERLSAKYCLGGLGWGRVVCVLCIKKGWDVSYSPHNQSLQPEPTQ